MALIGDSNIIRYKWDENDCLASRASTSFGEVTTSARSSYTPLRSDSNIIIRATFWNCTNTDHALHHWKIYNVTEGTFLNVPGSHASRIPCNAAGRGSYNNDNVIAQNIVVEDTSPDSGQNVYTLYERSYDGDNMKLNHSYGDNNSNVHWRTKLMWEFFEVENI